MKKIDPKVKDILHLLASGLLITSAILMPKTSLLYKEYLKHSKKKSYNEFSKYKLWRLKQILKRLQKQKIIEIKNDIILISDKGKKKVLKYDLETMRVPEKTDGKWRIIMYDIADVKKQERDLLRATLKRLMLLQIQKSVYLTPFVCEDEIEYIRQRFNIGNEVIVLKVIGIENEIAYKKYFGI